MIDINIIKAYSFSFKKDFIRFWFANCCLFYFIFTVNAYAYLDPGTGSLILQLILAGVAAFFAFFSRIKRNIKKIFNSKNVNDKNINKKHE